MAEVVLFASIREDLDCERLQITLPAASKVKDLIALLATEHGEHWRLALSVENVRVAVNQELVVGDPVLSNDDEIAFYPPVTGG